MKYKLVLIVVSLLLITSVIAINFPRLNPNPEPKPELTLSQVDKMVQLGIIRVHENVPNNENDKDIGMAYKTADGLCYLHQDIFGRYYCRW